MSSYNTFAEYYDQLMKKDFNYEQIADFTENLFTHYNCNPKLVCELACGTGNITIPLAKRGYDMIALDSSFDMLEQARKKAADDEISDILFLNQDMTKLDLYGTVDAFLCLIDGINYIINPNSLYRMFKRIKTCFLEPDGLFIFDISTEYKLKKIIGNNTFIHNGDDMFYTWENRYIENKRLSDMYLNFFAREKKGAYRRFAERHLQRAYSTDEILTMLKNAGFSNIDCYNGMSFNKPTKKTERIVFVAR